MSQETFDTAEQELYETWLGYYQGRYDLTDCEEASMNFVLAYPKEPQASIQQRGTAIKRIARTAAQRAREGDTES